MNSGRLRVLCLMLADALCVAACWFVVVRGYQVFGGEYCAADYLAAWPVPVVFAVINAFGRLYQGRWNYPAMPLAPVEEFRRLVLSSLATHVLVMAVLGFRRGADGVALSNQISRLVLVLSGVLVALTAQLFRDLVRLLLKRAGLGQIPAFVVGDGAVAARVAKSLSSDPYYGIRVVRTFSRAELGDVTAAGRAQGVKHLFACLGDSRVLTTRYFDWSGWFTFIEYLPTETAFPVVDARAVQIGGVGGIEMVNQRRMRLLALEKSVLDRILAGMIFLFSLGFFVVLPVLIKLTSRGPVFYRAKRLGKMGRTIYVWKFRSMYADADRRLKDLLDSDPKLREEFERDFKLKEDPRVTPLGRILRKTSLDELPQLINVFTHDMALVGPRPIVEDEIPKYGAAYEIFSSVKPGITGLWQASGRSDCSYDERVALDVHYVLNWSPWMDVWIVLRTVFAILRMKGSY